MAQDKNEFEFNIVLPAGSDWSQQFESTGTELYIEFTGDASFDGGTSTVAAYRTNGLSAQFGDTSQDQLSSVVVIAEETAHINSSNAAMTSKYFIVKYTAGDATAGNVEINIWQP